MELLEMDLSKMTRSDVVPYYVKLIQNKEVSALTIHLVNKRIMKYWPGDEFLYIKKKAWKVIDGTSRKRGIK